MSKMIFEVGDWVMDVGDNIGVVVDRRFGRYLVEFERSELLGARVEWVEQRLLALTKDPRPVSEAQRELDEYLKEE